MIDYRKRSRNTVACEPVYGRGLQCQGRPNSLHPPLAPPDRDAFLANEARRDNFCDPGDPSLSQQVKKISP